MNSINRIFIYGTLQPGKPNHHVMGSIQGSWMKATVKGTLVSQGWGAEQGCPGIVIDNSQNTVDGYLFESESLEELLPTLDKFEGGDYQRTETLAELADGSKVSAYIYALA